MGKMKNRINKISLRSSFIIYVAIFITIAVFLTIITGDFADSIWHDILKAYMNEDAIPSAIERNTYPPNIVNALSKNDRIIYEIFRLISAASAPIWFTVCIVIAAFLFYKNKLKKPVSILSNATDNIAENNLDFTVAYDKEDEMGKLCSSFEKMRVALQENNLEMWRQMDERKKLNAAFAHDLRTPLTVLKGHSEILLKYVPDGKIKNEKIVSIVATMQLHIARLEEYVFTMANLQKMADVDIQKANIPSNELCRLLKENAMLICADKELIFNNTRIANNNLNVDISIVIRVFENILSNAVRFAQNSITVFLSDDKTFSITISDDGQGFSNNDLLHATNPFYKSSYNPGTEHFGMGLNICKVLCEKHGGYIKLSNNSNGATVKAVF